MALHKKWILAGNLLGELGGSLRSLRLMAHFTAETPELRRARIRENNQVSDFLGKAVIDKGRSMFSPRRYGEC